jgi:hypothetical protein
MTSSVKSSSTKAAKIKGLQGKFEKDFLPEYIEINGVIYDGVEGFGNKARAEKELANIKERYGDGFIVETRSYKVFGVSKGKMKELSDLEGHAKSNENPKMRSLAKEWLTDKRKEIYKA